MSTGGVTVGLLGFFLILTTAGISESSVVAIGIFVFHLAVKPPASLAVTASAACRWT